MLTTLYYKLAGVHASNFKRFVRICNALETKVIIYSFVILMSLPYYCSRIIACILFYYYNNYVYYFCFVSAQPSGVCTTFRLISIGAERDLISRVRVIFYNFWFNTCFRFLFSLMNVNHGKNNTTSVKNLDFENIKSRRVVCK